MSVFSKTVSEIISNHLYKKSIFLNGLVFDEPQVIAIMDSMKLNYFIKRIQIENTEMTSFGWNKVFESIKINSNIRYLIIVSCRIPAFSLSYFSRILSQLSHDRSLLNIEIRNCELDNVGSSSFSTALSTNAPIQSLKLIHTNLDDEGCEKIILSIENNIYLETLDISNNYTRDISIAALSRALQINRTIKAIYISIDEGCDDTFALETILKEKSSSLRDLHFIGTSISKRLFSTLCNNLGYSQNLTTLSLQYLELESDSAMILSKALDTCVSLKMLDLSNNFITVTGACYLAIALQHKSKLNILNLSGNIIGNQGFWAISHALQNNKHLSELNVNSNEIDSMSFSTLMEFFHQNQSVEHLHLGYNIFASISIIDFFKAPLICNRVKTLDLSGIDETGKIMNDVLMGLKFCSSICSVKLNKNILSVDCSDPLESLLADTQNLKSIELNNCIFGKGLVDSISRGISLNHSLKEIKMAHSNINENDITVLLEGLQQNISITNLVLDEMYMKDFDNVLKRNLTFSNSSLMMDLSYLIGEN